MISETIEKITNAVIGAFIDRKEKENRTVEYKETLPGPSDDDKREFLADVSSFANAIGGDILYGVTAERDATGKATGCPERAVGVAVASTDAELLRLQSIVRDNLDPRLALIEFKFIDGFERGPVLIIRIGQSWASPHIVKYKNWSRFFTRSSAGRQQLDVRELRAAFAASEALPERIRSFREDRLARLVSGQSPLGYGKNKMLCMHLLPVAAFDRSPTVVPFIERFASLQPMQLNWIPSGHNKYRHNLDGYQIISPARDAEYRDLPYAKEYIQVFRNGCIECVSTLEMPGDLKDWLPEGIAETLTGCFQQYLDRLKKYELPLPIVLMVSMLGMQGTMIHIPDYKIPIQMQAAASGQHHPIDQNHVLLPEVLIETYEIPALGVLRPILDAMYQGFGYPQYFFVPH